MKDIEVAKRQVEAPNTGVGRRRAILARTRRRLESRLQGARLEVERILQETAELEAALAELATLERLHGETRMRDVQAHGGLTDLWSVDCDVDLEATSAYLDGLGVGFDGETVELGIDFPFERSADGFVWKLPIFRRETDAVSFEAFGVEKDALADNHMLRALAIPGYAHLAYLVQVQWMSTTPLDVAVLMAERRGVLGHVFAPDLIDCVVDGIATGVGGDRFWADREARRQADDLSSAG